MKWYRNLKTSSKLISSFVLVSLILAAVGIYSLTNLNSMKSHLSTMYETNLISIKSLSLTEIKYLQTRITLRGLSTMNTPAENDKIKNNIPTLVQDVNNSTTEYRNTILTPEEKTELANFDAYWLDYQNFINTYVQAAYQHDAAAFMKVQNDLIAKGTKVTDSLNKLISINVSLAEQTNKTTIHNYNQARTITIAVIIISFILSIFIGYFNAQIIGRPLGRIVTIVRKVAEGDLREKSDISTKDEVGQLANAFNEMIDNLRGLAGNILNSSHNVASASQQISASTEEIASSSNNQAYAAQTITELFKELSKAINSVAQSAEGAAELSNQTANLAKNGESVVQQTLSGMQDVNEKMLLLQSDSSKVGAIIELIDDIADQTNLLALNAAIEAARAGDQGRGFAVVADEVRKLAERSGEATKEITTIIRSMQNNIKQSVESVTLNVAESEKTGQAFDQIIEMVNESAYKVNEIAAASEEQAAQTQEVMNNVESIAAASEESASASQETAATSQSLAHLADELHTFVAVFKI